MNEGANASMSDEARELALYAENDRLLYENSWKIIVENLKKKIAKGVYKHDLALVAMRHHADRSAQSYAREFGGPDDKWYEMFTVEDRKQAAAHFVRDFETEHSVNQ